MLATRAADASCGLVYLNCVGGQDELVFDGASLVFDATGRLVASLPQFAEELAVVDLDVRPVYRKRLIDPRGHHSAPPLAGHRGDRRSPARARTCPGCRRREPRGCPPRPRSTRPWSPAPATTSGRTASRDVVIGLSGGIDSSLVAVVAADALGPEHVHGVSMPSRYSSEGASTDAAALAANLGIDYRTVPIEPAHAAFLDMLAPTFAGLAPGLTEENLQSRIRGVILDGAVQQAGLAGADHGQQERGGGRLLDPLRRHRRRVRGHQGRDEDAGLPAVRLAQRAGRCAGHPPGRADQAAVGRAAPRPA